MIPNLIPKESPFGGSFGYRANVIKTTRGGGLRGGRKAGDGGGVADEARK